MPISIFSQFYEMSKDKIFGVHNFKGPSNTKYRPNFSLDFRVYRIKEAWLISWHRRAKTFDVEP